MIKLRLGFDNANFDNCTICPAHQYKLGIGFSEKKTCIKQDCHNKATTKISKELFIFIISFYGKLSNKYCYGESLCRRCFDLLNKEKDNNLQIAFNQSMIF